MDDQTFFSAIEQLSSTDGHVRVLGPPGSGKTSILLERFKNLEKDGSRGQIAVVTYTRESRESLLSRLIPENSAYFGIVPVYRYHQLALGVIGASAPGRLRLIGDIEETVLLRRLLRSIQGELKSDFGATLHSVTFQKSVLGVVHVLLQIGVGHRYKRHLLDQSAPPRLQDLAKIYFAYREALDSSGYYTYHDAAWIAAGLLEQDPSLNPLAGAEKLLVEDFHDVDPGQYALIKAVAPPDGGVAVNVFGDPTGARFRDRGTSDQFLLHRFVADYRPADIVLPAGKANLNKLGPVVDTLLGETCGEKAVSVYQGTAGGDVDVTLSVAANEKVEAAGIADQIASLVRSGRYTPGEIAVAVREKNKYASLLKRTFRDRGLLLETGRRVLSPFAYFVYSLLRLVDRPGNELARNAVTTSPFFNGLRWVFEEVTGTPAEHSRSEALETIRAVLVRTANAENGDFDLLPLVSGWFKPLLRVTVTDERTDELLPFLGELTSEWRKYSDFLQGAGGRRTLPEFLSLSKALSPESEHKRHADRVGLYSCHELSSHRFPAVFLAGCSDLLFPALPGRPGYIPWGILQERLNAAVVDGPVELPRARTQKEFLKDEYALMLSALARAQSLLVISAPQQHRGVATPAPASVLRALDPGSPSADTGRKPAPYLRFASAVAAASPGAATALTGHRISDLWTRPVECRSAIRLRLKRLSPSTIQEYTKCPTRLFYSRVLRIEEEPTAAAAFGSLFHDLMNRLSLHYRTYIELRGIINSVRLNQHINDSIQASEYFSAASGIEQSAARFHLREMMTSFLEIDSMRSDDYYITTSEKRVGFEWLGWGFGGVADRVDRIAGGTYVVIDYKTGVVRKNGVTIRKQSMPGFDKPDERLWQVPLYTRGARPGDARLPEMFCYYVIQPGGDYFPVGLVIGEEEEVDKFRRIFGGADKKRFSYFTRDELKACLDEAAGIAEDIFADRYVFDRTTDRDRCSMCYFRRVCERTV